MILYAVGNAFGSLLAFKVSFSLGIREFRVAAILFTLSDICGALMQAGIVGAWIVYIVISAYVLSPLFYALSTWKEDAIPSRA